MTEQRIPDFIGLGAQKAGSSWIYMCLNDHPGLTIPEKDPVFFNDDDRYPSELDAYLEQMGTAAPQMLVGEFSTYYLHFADCAKRIYDVAPDAKLLVSMRHPVDRAHSHFKNDIIYGTVGETTTFEEALKANPEYLARGRYFEQLEPYLDLYPRERIGLFVYERSKTDAQAFIAGMYEFLGVDAEFTPGPLEHTVNKGRSPRSRAFDKALYASVRLARRYIPEKIQWEIRRRDWHEKLFQLNSKKDERIESLDPELRNDLFESFDADVARLEDLLGRELTEWKSD